MPEAKKKTAKKSDKYADLENHIKFLYKEMTELRAKLEKVMGRMGL